MTEGTKLYDDNDDADDDDDDDDDADDDGSRTVKDEVGPDVIVDIMPEVADVGSMVILKQFMLTICYTCTCRDRV